MWGASNSKLWYQSVLVQVAEMLGHSAYKATSFSASLNRLNMFPGV